MNEPSPPTPDDEPTRSRQTGRPTWHVLLPVVVILVVVAGFTILLSGPSKPKPALPGGVSEASAAATASTDSFAGGTLTPTKAAPATTLRNYLGQTVSLSEYRGKAVFVTFLYTHCPDVCPLIASNLYATQVALGAERAKVQMLAISVDPKGDTPSAVAAFLRAHRMVGQMQYLVGSAAQLGRVWAAWNVGSERDAASPELVDHSALVYGISATGALTTIYPADFKPADLVHDTPLLVSR
jgi:protein SCO1